MYNEADHVNALCCILAFFFPEYNISAAAISIFSLAFMILGSLCLAGTCCGGKGKRRDYLLKPAGMFFAFAGGCSLIQRVPLRHWHRGMQAPPLSLSLYLLGRPLCLHLAGGDATVSQAHDRQRGNDLDQPLLRLVLRLRLHRLHPPLPDWHHPADPLHAPDAQESMGDLHGRRAGASGVTGETVRGTQEEGCLLLWVQMLDSLWEQELATYGWGHGDSNWCGWTTVLMGNLPPNNYGNLKMGLFVRVLTIFWLCTAAKCQVYNSPHLLRPGSCWRMLKSDLRPITSTPQRSDGQSGPEAMVGCLALIWKLKHKEIVFPNVGKKKE